MNQSEFIELVNSIVEVRLKNMNLQSGHWNLGKVDTIVSRYALNAFVNGSTDSISIPCSPNIIFAPDDEIWIHYVNGDSRNKFVPYKRATGTETYDDGSGIGDMLKSIYDTTNNGKVDRAELSDTVTTNANLTGDITSVGNATTLTNAPVIAKVLTGYVSGAGVVSATDSILVAIQKLNGNDATNGNLTGDITSVGNATAIAAGVIVDADINPSATIAWSKISKTGASLNDFTTKSASDLSSGTLPAARMPALTGDITTTSGTVATSLSATGVSAGTYGSVTVDAKGRVTAATNPTTFPALYVNAVAPADTTLLWQPI